MNIENEIRKMYALTNTIQDVVLWYVYYTVPLRKYYLLFLLLLFGLSSRIGIQLRDTEKI